MDRGGNMLDKRKIRLMIKMASYEKQGAEEDLKISSYYKKDYVSMNVWATAIWFTIGYAIVAALIAFCTLEQILEKLTILKLLLLMGTAVGGYLILLILYCTGARTVSYTHLDVYKRQLRQGVISDYTVTEKMIQYFVRKAIGKRTFKKPRISICVPSGVRCV